MACMNVHLLLCKGIDVIEFVIKCEQKQLHSELVYKGC